MRNPFNSKNIKVVEPWAHPPIENGVKQWHLGVRTHTVGPPDAHRGCGNRDRERLPDLQQHMFVGDHSMTLLFLSLVFIT